MEKSWVMTEEERIQQSKLRQEKKRQKQSEEETRRRTLLANTELRLKPHQPSLQCRRNYLSDSQVSEIELLLDTFYRTYQTCPPPTDINPETMSCKLRVINVFANTVSRLVQYASYLPRFRHINANDRAILLKHGVLAMAILRGTMVYDSGNSFFSLKTAERRDSGVNISIEEMKQVLDEKLCHDHSKFVKAMKSLQLNEATLMLLKMVVLFSSDRIGLTDTVSITKEQEFYTDLLHRYMRWWYGEENAKIIYPKMLHRLVDLRSLTEAHSDNTVNIPDPDFNNLLNCFGRLGLNPYPDWDCFSRRPVRRRNSDNGIKSENTSSCHPVRSRSCDRNSSRGFPLDQISSILNADHDACVVDDIPLSYTGHVYVRRADDASCWQDDRPLYSQHLRHRSRAHKPHQAVPESHDIFLSHQPQHHQMQQQRMDHQQQHTVPQQHPLQHPHPLQHHHHLPPQQHQQDFFYSDHQETDWQHGGEGTSQLAPENISHWNSVEGLSEQKLPETDSSPSQHHKFPERQQGSFISSPAAFSSQDLIEFGTMFGSGIDKLISGAYDICTERSVVPSLQDTECSSGRGSEGGSALKTEQHHIDDRTLVNQVLSGLHTNSAVPLQQRSNQPSALVHLEPRTPAHQRSNHSAPLAHLEPGQQLMVTEQTSNIQASSSSSYPQDGVFPDVPNSADNSCYSRLDQWQ